MGAAGAKDHRLQMMLETELARVKALKEQYPVIDWHDEVPHFRRLLSIHYSRKISITPVHYRVETV